MRAGLGEYRAQMGSGGIIGDVQHARCIGEGCALRQLQGQPRFGAGKLEPFAQRLFGWAAGTAGVGDEQREPGAVAIFR